MMLSSCITSVTPSSNNRHKTFSWFCSHCIVKNCKIFYCSGIEYLKTSGELRISCLLKKLQLEEHQHNEYFCENCKCLKKSICSPKKYYQETLPFKIYSIFIFNYVQVCISVYEHVHVRTVATKARRVQYIPWSWRYCRCEQPLWVLGVKSSMLSPLQNHISDSLEKYILMLYLVALHSRFDAPFPLISSG